MIERLLGEFPGVYPVGEIVHVWQRGIVEGERCGCGRTFPECRFWREVGSVAFGGWENVDVARVTELRTAVDRTHLIPLLAARTRHVARGKLNEYLSYYLKVYDAIGQVSGCPVIVDSSKHASLAFCLRQSPGLDLRVIHVVRDSRAVAHSWTRRVHRSETTEPSYMATYSPAIAALHWNAQNGALQLLARSSTPTLRVHYEDLVTAPEETLARMATFTGVSTNGELAFVGSDGAGRWADLGTTHTASGNPMRFITGRIPIRMDELWRTAMSRAEQRIVTALTLPLLTHYGYQMRIPTP